MDSRTNWNCSSTTKIRSGSMAELRSNEVLSKQSQINKSFDSRIANLEARIQCFKIDLDFGHTAKGETVSQTLPDDKQENFNQIRAEDIIGGRYMYTGNNETGPDLSYEYVSLTRVKEATSGLYCVFGDEYGLQWNKTTGSFFAKDSIQYDDTGSLILFYIQ